MRSKQNIMETQNVLKSNLTMIHSTMILPSEFDM